MYNVFTCLCVLFGTNNAYRVGVMDFGYIRFFIFPCTAKARKCYNMDVKRLIDARLPVRKGVWL